MGIYLDSATQFSRKQTTGASGHSDRNTLSSNSALIGGRSISILKSILKKNLPLIIICIFGTLLRFNKLGVLIFHLDEPLDSVRIAAKSLSFNVTHDYGSVLYQVVTH
ncbi:MAG: hypothetical protein KJ874_10040, partial [Acidobacteria bacterium]|nr:hypothetical protein [Acidobacteriota bacterium]